MPHPRRHLGLAVLESGHMPTKTKTPQSTTAFEKFRQTVKQILSVQKKDLPKKKK
jgi:hypothetical protein